MPEGPEVCITAEILEKRLKFVKIYDAKILSGRYYKKKPDLFLQWKKAFPLRIEKVCSHGKFLYFILEDNWYIWNTFGLTGGWDLHSTPYDRIVIQTGEGKIYFRDMRNFGTFKISRSFEELRKKLKQLAPDFLKAEDIPWERINKYHLPIVAILTSQKKVGSGIGNYLSAEILYHAKISPYTYGDEIRGKKLQRLIYAIKYVIKLAYQRNNIGYFKLIEREVKNFRRNNYHPEITLGREMFQFKVYRQKYDPYGNPVRRDKIVPGRSTYWVENVQK